MTETDYATLQEVLLVQKAVADAGEFLALYDRYFPRVYTYFRCRIDDPATCDDLTAQVFENALSGLAGYDPGRGVFAAWLFGIARNLANETLRRSLRFTWLPFDWLGRQPEEAPTPEEAALNMDEQRRLLVCLQRLSSRQRDLLALRFSAGLNNRQIARLTGLTEQNVAVSLHRAIRALRADLVKEEGIDV
jgi:RNA polymerase sigma-70 factor (ECF subfamily)